MGSHFETIVDTLSPRARALFRVGRVQSSVNGHIVVTVPNAAHLERAREHEADLATALTTAVGPITLELGVADDAGVSSAEVSSQSVIPDSNDLAGPDDYVDLSALVDAPNDPGISALDQISAIFPGTQVVSDEGAS